VKYISLREPSGYGVAARRYLLALMGAGVPLTWTPMVPGPGWRLGYEPYLARSISDPQFASICNRRIDYDTLLVHTVPEYFPRWRAMEPGKRIVGYTTWETTRLSYHWPPLLNAMDLLLVPSQWNRDVFRECGVTTPIEVVPHITHPGPFPERSPPTEIVFYTIGPWTVRKAMANVLEAYCRAFRSGERVRLIVKTSPEDFTRPPALRRLARYFGSATAAISRVLGRHRSHAPVEVVTRTLSDSEIDAFHIKGDCFVSLSHGEGWSIPAFDAAAFGNPVISTRFGGPLEYLSAASAYLVDCTLAAVQDPREPRSYARNQDWAMPDLDVAARLMRDIYERNDEARARGRTLAREVRTRFAETAVLHTMLSVL
jgi:glycosyltransferase involved in cell wall biosynthesis